MATAADRWCQKWLGLTAMRTNLMVASALLLGGAMELFMINVWIKDTNFYSVVLKKEAERRQEQAELAAQTGQKPFVDVLKEQWEAKKKELGLQKTRPQ